MAKHLPNLDINRLLQYLRSPEHSTEEEQWLREQLGSQELQDKLWALGTAVFPDKLCWVCKAVLPYYVHLKAMGEDADSEYPQIKAHLDLCSRCSGEYEELYQMVSAAYADETPAAPSYPVFDLPFLTQPVETPVLDWPQLWEDVTSAGARVHRLISEITLSLAAPFTQLAAPLHPALVAIPVPAQRKRDVFVEGAETIEVLDLQYPPANLLIRIGRGPVVAQRTAVVIDVLQMEPPQPILAARVTLYDERHRLMERIGTDVAGSVRFEDVRTGKYFVQVQYAEDTWELPLVLGTSS